MNYMNKSMLNIKYGFSANFFLREKSFLTKKTFPYLTKLLSKQKASLTSSSTQRQLFPDYYLASFLFSNHDCSFAP